MAEYIVRPRGLLFLDETGASGAIVGDDDTVWQDSSDATYVRQYAYHDGFGTYQDTIQAALDPPPDSIDPNTVTSVTCTVRAVFQTGAASDAEFHIAVLDFPAKFGGVFGVSEWVWPADAATYQLTEPLDPDELDFYSKTIADFVEYLQSGIKTLIVRPSAAMSPNDAIVRSDIFELWITITYPDPEEPTVPRRRIFGRNDLSVFPNRTPQQGLRPGAWGAL